MHRHASNATVIKEEGSDPLPRCVLCDMFVTRMALHSTHWQSKDCREGQARKDRRLAAEDARRAQEVVLTAHGDEFGTTDVFKHLGQALLHNDDDWPAVTGNLKKAHLKWAKLSRTLGW